MELISSAPWERTLRKWTHTVWNTSFITAHLVFAEIIIFLKVWFESLYFVFAPLRCHSDGTKKDPLKISSMVRGITHFCLVKLLL